MQGYLSTCTFLATAYIKEGTEGKSTCTKASFLSSLILLRSKHRINQLSTSVIGSDRLKLMVECNQIKDFGPSIFFSKASGYHVP